MPFSKYGPGWLCLYHGWESWNSPIHCGTAVVAFYQTGPCIVSVLFGSSHTVCEVLFLDHWNILWHNIGAICGSFHRWFICNSGGRSRFCSPVSLGCLRHYSTIFVTNRLNRNRFSWIFSKISYIHSSHLCRHSNVSLSFPNVEPCVFWSTETTVISKSTLGKGKRAQLSQDFWRVL